MSRRTRIAGGIPLLANLKMLQSTSRQVGQLSVILMPGVIPALHDMLTRSVASGFTLRAVLSSPCVHIKGAWGFDGSELWQRRADSSMGMWVSQCHDVGLGASAPSSFSLFQPLSRTRRSTDPRLGRKGLESGLRSRGKGATEREAGWHVEVDWNDW